MKNIFYHAFNPSFSPVVLVCLSTISIIAIIRGYRSVRVRARDTRGNIWKNLARSASSPAIAALCKQLAKAEPKFKSEKVAKIREDFDYSYQTKKRADSTIVFSSKTIDLIESAIAGLVFFAVLTREHFDGLTQLAWNSGNTEIAGILSAFLIVSLSSVYVGFCYHSLRSAIEHLRASRIIIQYIGNHNRVPALHEQCTIGFFINHSVWAIKADWQLRAIEKAEAEASGKKQSKVIRFPFRKVG